MAVSEHSHVHCRCMRDWINAGSRAGRCSCCPPTPSTTTTLPPSYQEVPSTPPLLALHPIRSCPPPHLYQTSIVPEAALRPTSISPPSYQKLSSNPPLPFRIQGFLPHALPGAALHPMHLYQTSILPGGALHPTSINPQSYQELPSTPPLSDLHPTRSCPPPHLYQPPILSGAALHPTSISPLFYQKLPSNPPLPFALSAAALFPTRGYLLFY